MPGSDTSQAAASQGTVIPLDRALVDHARLVDYAKQARRNGNAARRNLSSLTAMSVDRDPFAARREGRAQAARWFQQLWSTIALPSVHLRR